MSGSGAGSVAQVTKRTSGIDGLWPRWSRACSPRAARLATVRRIGRVGDDPAGAFDHLPRPTTARRPRRRTTSTTTACPTDCAAGRTADPRRLAVRAGRRLRGNVRARRRVAPARVVARGLPRRSVAAAAARAPVHRVRRRDPHRRDGRAHRRGRAGGRRVQEALRRALPDPAHGARRRVRRERRRLGGREQHLRVQLPRGHRRRAVGPSTRTARRSTSTRCRTRTSTATGTSSTRRPRPTWTAAAPTPG